MTFVCCLPLFHTTFVRRLPLFGTSYDFLAEMTALISSMMPLALCGGMRMFTAALIISVAEGSSRKTHRTLPRRRQYR